MIIKHIKHPIPSPFINSSAERKVFNEFSWGYLSHKTPPHRHRITQKHAFRRLAHRQTTFIALSLLSLALLWLLHKIAKTIHIMSFLFPELLKSIHPGSMLWVFKTKQKLLLLWFSSMFYFWSWIFFIFLFAVKKPTTTKQQWNGRRRRCEMWRLTCSSSSPLRFLHWKSNDAYELVQKRNNLSVSEHQMTTSCFLICLISHIVPSFISGCREYFFSSVFCSFWVSDCH